MTDTDNRWHGQSQNTGSPGQPDQLQKLEHLLSNITQHLQATGNRHSDVLQQLNDRLSYLRNKAFQATPDAERHLQMFEAQLTSLAIKTGVPLNHRQNQRRESALPPLGGPAVPQSLPTPTPDVPISASAHAQPPAQQPMRRPEVSNAKPIGAPPPTHPVPPTTGPDPLTRGSDVSFEDALAADQNSAQPQATDSTIEGEREGSIFAYQPSKNYQAPQDVSAPPDVVEANPPAPDVDNASRIAQDEVDAVASAPNADVSQPAEEKNEHEAIQPAAQISKTPSEGVDTPEPEQDVQANLTDTRDPSSELLRKDLDTLLSSNLTSSSTAKSVTRNTERAPEHAPAKQALFKLPELEEITKTKDLSDERSSPAVLKEIARLSNKVDAVSDHVDGLAKDVAASRAELPEMLQKSTMEAAQIVAAKTVQSGQETNKRLEELQNIIQGYVSTQRESDGRAPLAEVDIPQPSVADPSPANMPSLAKKKVLDRLAPVGIALSNTLAKSSSPEPADRTNETTDLAFDTEFDASEHTPDQPNIYPEHMLPAHDVQHDPQEQAYRSTRQPIHGLRRTINQTGTPPALMLAIFAMMVTSGMLIWSSLSGEKETTAQVATQEQQQPAQAKPIAGTATPQKNAGTEEKATKTELAARVATAPAVASQNRPEASKDQAGKTSTVSQLEPTASGPAQGASETDAPINPTALTPNASVLPQQQSPSTGSKLQLPPLATGPLSLRVAAANGDPAAQFDVAARLSRGHGVKKDPVAAVKWYTRAASAGHAQAQYRLAALYERGSGVAADSGRAKVWYTRAAQQGNIKAMHNLAVLYAGQATGSPNYVSAAQWFEKAAEYDLADSQFNVAILYMNGLGVTKNLETAYKWFALAARQGDQEARRRLAGLNSRMTADDQAKAKKIVQTWRPKKINQAANVVRPWRPKSASDAPKTSQFLKEAETALQAAINPEEGRKKDIETVQRILGELSFDVGKPDGVMGSKTSGAIKTFQTQNGMIPTGTIDDALIERLKRAARERAAKLGQL